MTVDIAARLTEVMPGLRRDLDDLARIQSVAGDPPHAARLKHLRDDVHMSQSALSRLISRLETDGLVERRSCSDDRRGIYACITEAGLKRLEEALPTQQEVLEKTL